MRKDEDDLLSSIPNEPDPDITEDELEDAYWHDTFREIVSKLRKTGRRAFQHLRKDG